MGIERALLLIMASGYLGSGCFPASQRLNPALKPSDFYRDLDLENLLLQNSPDPNRVVFSKVTRGCGHSDEAICVKTYRAELAVKGMTPAEVVAKIRRNVDERTSRGESVNRFAGDQGPLQFMAGYDSQGRRGIISAVLIPEEENDCVLVLTIAEAPARLSTGKTEAERAMRNALNSRDVEHR